MRNVRSTCTRTLLLTLFFLLGCKEFYDEEYEEDPNSSGTTSSQENANTHYEATLAGTSTALTNLQGTGKVVVQGNDVTVNIQASGIPDNLLQIHYGYIAAACSTLNVAIPTSATGTKTFSLQETTTLSSLQQDLATSGASSAPGDQDLSTKSLVVKAFSSVATGNTGTAGLPLMIACGDLNVADDASGAGTTSTSTASTGTTGTTTTGATTGTFGTSTTGTFGTATTGL